MTVCLAPSNKPRCFPIPLSCQISGPLKYPFLRRKLAVFYAVFTHSRGRRPNVLDFYNGNSLVLPVAALKRETGNNTANIPKSFFLPNHTHVSKISAAFLAIISSRGWASLVSFSSSSFRLSNFSLKSSSGATPT